MDRQTVYPGQILPETTLLQIAKDSMIGLAKLSAAMLGTSTMANGFATAPTSPASLQVVVAAGELYALTTIDATAWSSLPADTTHSIMKQGIALDSTTLTCAAPTTTGQSINYLVEVAYQDLDATPVLLPYYNSANPSQPYSGQGNNGLTQNTVRKGAVIVQVKAGASAATGSQITPSPDSGYVGLYVVTVAYGQTTITTSNISRYSAAPLLPAGLVQSVQNGTLSYAAGTGAANAYTASYAPAITALTDGLTLHSTAIAANTGASTFAPNGLTAKPILSLGQVALQGGEFVANSRFSVRYSLTLDSWILLSASGGNAMSGRLLSVRTLSSSGTYTPTVGTNSVFVQQVGGGGAGGGSVATAAAQVAIGGAGSSGAYSESYLTTGFSGVSYSVGAGGVGVSGAAGGGGGNTTFGSATAFGGAGGIIGSAASNTVISVIQPNGGGTNATGGNLVNAKGNAFVLGLNLSASVAISGVGNPSFFGAGGNAVIGATGAGGAATSPGAGGGGALTVASGAAQVGGNGAAGLIIVWEYA